MTSQRPSARPSRGLSSHRPGGPDSDSPVRLHDGALQVGHAEVPLWCGAVHYWRLERDAWRNALEEMRSMGLGVVETYAPWQVHERARGEFDFGEDDRRKDLGAFLDLAAELGFYVFIRPGPHINSEMTWFGLPERVVYDRAVQARSPAQNPVILPFPPRMFPVPSYASEQYHEEVGRWYEAVAEVVAPRVWPHGPIVMIQVDNEATYYFRDHQYDQDYHPDSVAGFRAWIQERYRTVAELNRAHRREYRDWSDVEAPVKFDVTRFEQLAIHLDWAAWREELIARSLTRFRDKLRSLGISGIPTAHNLPLGEQGAAISTPRLEEVVDVCGLDFYHARREYRTIKRRALYIAGTSRLPFSPEMGAGAPPWFTPLTHDDSLFCAMTACAFGLRGFSMYMAVDRDRWYGAPIDAEGNPRIEAGAWKNFLGALTETRFHSLMRQAPVALMIPREYARLSRATHLLGLFSPLIMDAIGGTPVDACSEDDLGFGGPIQVLWWRMLARFAEALTAAGIPYVYVDGDCSLEMLERFRVIVSPSYEYADVARWKRLCSFAEQGGTVVFGPAMPTHDESMRTKPFQVPTDGKKVLIDELEDAHDVVYQLRNELDHTPAFAARPSPVEVTVHEDERGPVVVFVIHPGTIPVQAHIDLPSAMELEDATSGDRFRGETVLTIPMAPLSCRMLIVRSNAALGLELLGGSAS